MEETGGQFSPSDEAILGTPFYRAASRNGGSVPKGYKPQPYLYLRGNFGQSYALKRNNEELGQISAMRRFREAYIGAIFPFFGHRYRVHSHEEHSVILEEVEQYLRTDPGFYTALTRSNILEGVGYGDLSVYYGSVDVVTNFTGYNLVDERSSEVIRTGGDRDALFLNNIHSFWVDIPPNSTAAEGIGAVEQMFRVGAMFIVPIDRFDISTSSRAGSDPTAYCYENYSGGIGVAKKLFTVWPAALSKGLEIARNCRCPNGCQNCIEPAKSWGSSNANINKAEGIELAQQLLGAESRGPDRKFANGLMAPL